MRPLFNCSLDKTSFLRRRESRLIRKLDSRLRGNDGNRVFQRANVSHNYGFTLVELIVVIAITGILAAGAALFIRNPTQSFIDTENRANLTDRADTALRRMARDIRNALPNSVRVTTNGLDSFIEFVPVKAAGRYRAAKGPLGSEDELDFSLPSDTFEVLGPPVTVAAGDKLVIYNLGISKSDVNPCSVVNPCSDVYEGTNIQPVQATIKPNILSFSGGIFPQPSPSSRFYVVSTPVSYVCDMTNHVLLMYGGYAIQTSQPASVATLNGLATGRQVADNLSSCQISYGPGMQQRSGIVTIYLGFTQDTASVKLMHQVNVVNSP